MAPKAFAWRWRDEVDSRIADDRDYAQTLRHIVARLNDHQQPRRALDDVVSQRWSDARSDWYDAAAQIEIGERLQVGWCVAAILPVGANPGPDKDVSENQRKLRALPSPHVAHCRSGPGDDDGYLEWERPVRVQHRMQDDQLVAVEFEPTFVPLEIGHTNPETTVWHLLETGGVARWPYGHDKITLLLSTRMSIGRQGPAHRFVEGQPIIEPPG